MRKDCNNFLRALIELRSQNNSGKLNSRSDRSLREEKKHMRESTLAEQGLKKRPPCEEEKRKTARVVEFLQAEHGRL